jgi:ATP-dependent Clp protease adaptor protein ClpS
MGRGAGIWQQLKARTGNIGRNRFMPYNRTMRTYLANDPAGPVPPAVKPRVRTRTKVERPRLHKVILVNDDFTPRDFVTSVLKAEFRLSEDQAYRVMITAHMRGVCVVAVFPRDVAETKATRATDAGRSKGYPLLFTTEPEE